MIQPKKPVKKYVPTAKEKKNLKDATEQKNMRDPFTPAERKKMPRVGSIGTAKNGKTISKAKNGTSVPKKNSVSRNVSNLNKAKFGDMLGKAAGSGMFGLAGMAANKLFGGKKKTGGTVKKCRGGCK
jgi:hypothetical protein